MRPDLTALGRTLLLLGRGTHLPTVGSNALLGWWLAGGSSWGALLGLGAGVAFLFLGSQLLRWGFEAGAPGVYGRLRPTLASALPWKALPGLGLVWMGTGVFMLARFGLATAGLALLLGLALGLEALLYRRVLFSPCLLAVSRCLLYLVAASTGATGIPGLALWGGLALGGYVTGIGLLERAQKTGPAGPGWEVGLMALPLLLAVVLNGPGFLLATLFWALMLAGWIVFCLRYAWRPVHRNVLYSVAGLWSGVVLVDVLLAAPVAPAFGLILLCWFAADLLLPALGPQA